MNKYTSKGFRKFFKDRSPYELSVFDDRIRNYNKEVPKEVMALANKDSRIKAGLPVSGIQTDYINPTIIEERELHISQMDVFSRLMMDRQIYFGNEVNSETCSITIAQLLYLDSVSNEDITMYICSPGGSVIDGFGLIDTMGMIKSNIVTVGTGMAASMGSLLISSGTRGKRKALENSWVMLHQLSSGVKGKFRDIITEAEFCKRLTERLYKHLSQRTGQPYDKIVDACENGDKWLSAEEAKDFGLIDEVIYTAWD